MIGDMLRHFQFAAVLQVGGDASGAESMIADLRPMPAAFARLWIGLTHVWILIGGGARLEPRQGVGIFFPAPGNFLNRSVKRRIILRDFCCIILRTQPVSSNEESRKQLGR